MVFIFSTIILTASSQVLIKIGVNRIVPGDHGLLHVAVSGLTSPWVIAGLTAAFGAAVSWILAMSKSELSFAYPFMGLGIVLTLVLSATILGEVVPWNRWVGVLVVCLGIWIATQ